MPSTSALDASSSSNSASRDEASACPAALVSSRRTPSDHVAVLSRAWPVRNGFARRDSARGLRRGYRRPVTFDQHAAAATGSSHDSVPQRVVTVIQHAEDIPLDRFAEWLEDGVQVRVVRVDLGEAVPASAAEVGDGLVVLGGERSAYDDAEWPWLPSTRELLASAARSGVPTLAICLGAQLLAVAGGGRVQVAAPPGVEAGPVAVRWRPEAASDPLLGRLVAASPTGAVLPSLHGDSVVELPAGAVWLGSSSMYPFQSFRWGSAWGVQFHPEASPATVGHWARQTPGVDADAVEADLVAVDEEVLASGRLLAEAFVAVVLAGELAGARTAP